MTTSLALVPVFSGALNGQFVQLCDARTLHTFMGVLRDFSTWVKGRIRKFGFIEGVDYLLTKSGEQVPHQGGTRNVVVTDYHLTLDMAKELAMVENNDKGREARRYFIDCEKRATRPMLVSTPYAVLPGQTLNESQADTLRNLLTDFAISMPLDLRGLILREGWSKLKSHFKTDYRHIPQVEFNEAISIISRHIAKWAPCDLKRTQPAPALEYAANEKNSFPEPVKTLDIDTLIAFITGGLIDRNALMKIADASGMALHSDMCNVKQTGWGQSVADQIDDTLPQADLRIVAIKAVQTMWRRATVPPKSERHAPQRAQFATT